MKITNVETFIVDAGWRPWVFVKVEADDGTVAVRRLGSKNQEILALDDVVGQLSAEAASPAAK